MLSNILSILHEQYTVYPHKIMKLLYRVAKLPNANEKPNLLVILNFQEETVYVHGKDISSSDDVQQVADDFRADKLPFRHVKSK